MMKYSRVLVVVEKNSLEMYWFFLERTKKDVISIVLLVTYNI
jgi:hypothetical protein